MITSKAHLSAGLTLLVLLTVSGFVTADKLTVVADHGGVSALPYYQELAPQGSASSKSVFEGAKIKPQSVFPVKTPELTPGTVQGRVINAPGLRPVFLIGDDERSQAWLQQRRDQLVQISAVGLVVNVASEGRLNAMKAWAPGLPLAPTSGSDIATRLGLSHYPVLITPTTIQP